MKERKKILNTLAKRTLVTLIAVNLVIFGVTNWCIPQLFYRYLKEEAVMRKKAEVEGIGVRSNMSFLNYLNFENSKRIVQNSLAIFCLTVQSISFSLMIDADCPIDFPLDNLHLFKTILRLF